MTKTLFTRFADRLFSFAIRSAPDEIIGGQDNPYMLRWWLVPRNRLMNVYLHLFLRSDDDRALHDHPWPNMSVLLRGCYSEHTIRAGGVHEITEYVAGNVRLRGPWFAHRIELTSGPCWSLFITGPKVRAWGFHCKGGWVHWRKFTAPEDKGVVGKGCSE